MNLKTKKLTYCALFAVLIAVGAFIQIPVPGMDYFTLQFLFVILSGMILGPKLGAISVGTYLAVGLIGVPIFAAGGGISYIVRPSFGYLLAFVLASFICGYIVKKLRAKNYGVFLISAFAGLIVTYVIGLTYKYLILNLYMGDETPFLLVFLSCFPLDLPGDIALCFVGSFLGFRLKKVLKLGDING